MNPGSIRPRVLVTGGAGFVGSHLSEKLARSGCHVTVVDNLSTGRRSNLDAVPPDRLRFVEADLIDALPTLDPAAFDEIYHLAAAVGVRLVIEEPVRTIRSNVVDTLAVLEFAAEARVPTLLTSTSEVYGKSTRTPFREDDDVVYGPTIYSRWSYACSKAIDEYLALAFARTSSLPIVIARLFNTVGPRQVGRYGMVVPRFVEAALKNEPLPVYGDGEQTRCFCDVRDVAELLPRMLRTEAARGRVFNVGRDESISIGDLARLVIKTLESGSQAELVSYEEAYGEGFDDLRHRQPDLARLREAVGFEPRFPLTRTIRDLAAEMASEEPGRREVCRP